MPRLLAAELTLRGALEYRELMLLNLIALIPGESRSEVTTAHSVFSSRIPLR